MMPPDQDLPGKPEDRDIQAIEQIEANAKTAYSAKEAVEPSYGKGISELEFKRKASDQKFRDQIVAFRLWLIVFILAMMALETIVLFVIIILASLPCPKLKIEPLTLQVLVGATIAQVSAMLIVIIRSVYSDSLNRLVMSDKRRPPE
jgi:hypothetical protein